MEPDDVCYAKIHISENEATSSGIRLKVLLNVLVSNHDFCHQHIFVGLLSLQHFTNKKIKTSFTHDLRSTYFKGRFAEFRNFPICRTLSEAASAREKNVAVVFMHQPSLAHRRMWRLASSRAQYLLNAALRRVPNHLAGRGLTLGLCPVITQWKFAAISHLPRRRPPYQQRLPATLACSSHTIHHLMREKHSMEEWDRNLAVSPLCVWHKGCIFHVHCKSLLLKQLLIKVNVSSLLFVHL